MKEICMFLGLIGIGYIHSKSKRNVIRKINEINIVVVNDSTNSLANDLANKNRLIGLHNYIIYHL